MKKEQSDRQEMLNRHYSGKIIRALSEPIQDESEKSDISYAEAKKILKHTIRRIKDLRIFGMNGGKKEEERLECLLKKEEEKFERLMNNYLKSHKRVMFSAGSEGEAKEDVDSDETSTSGHS